MVIPRSTVLVATLIALGTTYPTQGSVPNLKNQKKWSASEKNNFFKFLKKEGGLDDAPNKSVTLESELSQSLVGDHYGTYLGAGYRFHSIFFHDLEKTDWGSFLHGPELTLGRPLLSWFRLALSASYVVNQNSARSPIPRLSRRLHGIGAALFAEAALIPLGSPFTRYLLLRAGMSVEQLWSRDNAVTRFRASPLASAGYEWQLGENFFRFNALIQASYPILGPQTERYLEVGPQLGLAYVF